MTLQALLWYAIESYVKAGSRTLHFCCASLQMDLSEPPPQQRHNIHRHKTQAALPSCTLPRFAHQLESPQLSGNQPVMS